MKCPSCHRQGSTIIRRDGWSGMFQVRDGREEQLSGWYCVSCGFQGTKDLFEPTQEKGKS